MSKIKTRGTEYYDCINVKHTNDNNDNPSFFAYKCDHENNVQYTTKYFAKSDNPSYIYVTYIPVGCKNKKLRVSKVSSKDAYEYFSNEDNIPMISDRKEIDGKKIIRLIKLI